MKHIEDIEKMSVEELIIIAEDMPVEVPDDLDKNISEALMAQTALADIPKSAQTVRRLLYATTAAAACLAVFPDGPVSQKTLSMTRIWHMPSLKRHFRISPQKWTRVWK